MADQLDTTSAVMDVLGGNTAVARLTRRRSPKVAANWRHFKTFPPDTYLVMTHALVRAGRTPPHHSLWRMIDPDPPTD
jgi:hypothetical protein